MVGKPEATICSLITSGLPVIRSEYSASIHANYLLCARLHEVKSPAIPAKIEPQTVVHYADKRWWILSVSWDGEEFINPIPAELLPKK